MAAPTPPATTFRIPRLDDTEQRLLFKIANILSTGLGDQGIDWVLDAAAHGPGDWRAFHAVEDSVITSITYKSGFSTGNPAGKTIKGGDTIYGPILSLQLASGSGILYRA